MRYALVRDGNVEAYIVGPEDYIRWYAGQIGCTVEEAPDEEPQAPYDYEPEPTEMERLRADVDYIAVMTGVEL